MDIFDFLTMIGGLSLFLFGMNVMGQALERRAGGGLRTVLGKLTTGKAAGLLTGLGVTAVIQSSSATTVMVVGFVNSGLMRLEQAVGIIMGANIGTTVTSWLLSLSGLESDNFFLTLLKPETFSPVLALAGVILLMSGKSERKKSTGGILLGFSILMFGMNTMSAAVSPLKDIPEFAGLLTAFSNPVMGVLAGTVLTALLQSSSASVGILQAFCVTGAIPYSAVLPIIMGQNIGTCITALLSSIGAKANAKRAAFIHLYFNLIGTVLFMCGFYLVHAIMPFRFFGQAASPAGIAMVHSFFNIFSTAVLLPFSKQLVALARISVPEKDTRTTADTPARLAALSNMDKRFLENPSLALCQCRKTTGAMLMLAGEAAHEALTLLSSYQKEKAAYVETLENDVDQYEDNINDYLFRISHFSLSETDSRELSLMQHCVGDIERIADYALNTVISIGKIEKKELHFSKEAEEELAQYGDIVLAIVKDTMDYWEAPAPLIANNACQLENERNRIEKRLLKNHKKRLKKGKCSVNMGFILSDILTSLSRIAKHSIHIIQISQSFYPE